MARSTTKINLVPKENESEVLSLEKERELQSYADHMSFLFSKIGATATSWIIYFFSFEPALFYCSITFTLLLVSDIFLLWSHKKFINNLSVRFKKLSSFSSHLTTAFLMVMGAWCFACYYFTKEPFIHILALTIGLGSILSLITKKFAKNLNLIVQICVIAFPLMLGIAYTKDVQSVLIAAFFLPLFASVIGISDRFKMLFDRLETQELEKSHFGIQLNEALESMSHGLIMFDEEMKLKIINETARNILGIYPEINCYSRTLYEIGRLVDSHKPLINRVRILEESLTHRLRKQSTNKVFKVSKNQFIELSIKLRQQGGCVLVIEDVSQRMEYQARINELARYDELTGLYNRNYFIDQSKKILQNTRSGQIGAVLFMDLDDFKKVNDTLGHEAGDFILTNVADRIRRILPPTAIGCRYGGDEFVAFFQCSEQSKSLEMVAQKIIEELPKQLTFNNQVLNFGVSMGISRFPHDGSSIDRLLKLSDLAMYHAKAHGKNRYKFFTSELENILQERNLLENDLAKAVKSKGLELHFQPIVSSTSGKTIIFEALTRWKRNGKEMVSPAQFIPLAEDLGLIAEIGEWTLIEACSQCVTWPEEISVAVNVSAVQFHVGSIITAVKSALEQSGLSPSRLEIEITETAVLNDLNHAIVVLEELSSLGVKISLDDFGTGYSSLSYLHKLPLHKVKIDKSFIDDLENSQRSHTMLKGITSLAKGLELKTVVEGIETHEQCHLLKQFYEVDYLQGYYFSKALPAESARNYARQSSQDTSPLSGTYIEKAPSIADTPSETALEKYTQTHAA